MPFDDDELEQSLSHLVARLTCANRSGGEQCETRQIEARSWPNKQTQGIVFIFVPPSRVVRARVSRAIQDRRLCSDDDDEETRKHRSIDAARARTRVDSLMIELERPYQ